MRKACLDQIYNLARKDKRVIFIGSDIAAGTLEQFKKEMPERYFMEGASEANIIGMISGMAMNGKIPYLNTIAVFLTRRCYEQILLDAAMHNLKIRLIGSGGGLVYAPLGPTHLAFEDISLMRIIPNMAIVAPCDAEEMKRLMPQTLDYEGPIYIRLAKGGDPVVSSADKGFKIGRAILLREGKDALIITTGIMLKPALDASGELSSKGIGLKVLHMHTIKPIDRAAVMENSSQVKAIVTLEENSVVGGLGSAVAEIVAEAGFSPAKKFLRIGLADAFPAHYGSQQKLISFYGLTKEKIVSSLQGLLNT